MAAVIQPIEAVKTMGLHSIPVLPNQIEGSSQTFKQGTPLVWSSGKIVAAGATPTSGLVGISAGIGQNVTTSPFCIVIPFLKNNVFEISVDGTLNGGNAPGTGSLAIANIGTTYAITQDAASGLWYLVTSGGTATVLLLGFQTNANKTTSDSGVVNGRALVSFLTSTSVWT